MTIYIYCMRGVNRDRVEAYDRITETEQERVQSKRNRGIWICARGAAIDASTDHSSTTGHQTNDVVFDLDDKWSKTKERFEETR